MKEKCGLFGLYLHSPNSNSLQTTINGLKLLQHRGQEGAGISYVHDSTLCHKKGIGLVEKVFEDFDTNIETDKCIGHVRYSTSGLSKQNTLSQLDECQPLFGSTKKQDFFLAHNGNIPSIKQHDTQFLIKIIQDNSNSNSNSNNNNNCNLENGLIYLIENISFAYCLLILTNDTIYAVRDRYGIRPLCLGFLNKDICVSSESCALGKFNHLRDVSPGEIVKIDKSGINSIYQCSQSQLSICALEFIYFMRPNSFSDGYYVSNVRKNLGIFMADKEDLDLSQNLSQNLNQNNFIVVGVPFSGIISAQAYANKLKLEYKQLIDKRNNKRTFIAPSDKERKLLCDKKFIFDVDNLKNKKIILIDDSLVRGNVIKSIIHKLWDIGVLEIHVRITSPPVIDRCQLGIDIVSKDELLAVNKSTDDIANILKINSIKYLTCQELKNTIPHKSYMECFGENIIIH